MLVECTQCPEGALEDAQRGTRKMFIHAPAYEWLEGSRRVERGKRVRTSRRVSGGRDDLNRISLRASERQEKGEGVKKTGGGRAEG